VLNACIETPDPFSANGIKEISKPEETWRDQRRYTERFGAGFRLRAGGRRACIRAAMPPVAYVAQLFSEGVRQALRNFWHRKVKKLSEQGNEDRISMPTRTRKARTPTNPGSRAVQRITSKADAEMAKLTADLKEIAPNAAARQADFDNYRKRAREGAFLRIPSAPPLG